jgi:hypothetical protein
MEEQRTEDQACAAVHGAPKRTATTLPKAMSMLLPT